MTVARPCPHCGPRTEMVIEYDGGRGYSAYCSGCYDADCVGDPPRFVSSSLMGRGRDWVEAVEDWNYLVDDATYVEAAS